MGHTVIEVAGVEYLISWGHLQNKVNIMDKGVAVFQRQGGFSERYIRLNLELVLSGYKVGSHNRGQTRYFKEKIKFG